MVVKSRGSFVKSSSVRRAREAEFLAVEMMAKLVAERAQERAERSYLLAHGGTGPYTDVSIAKGIVAEEFRLPTSLPHAKGSSGERTNIGSADAVKGGCRTQKFMARASDLGARAFLHNGADRLCEL